VNIVAVCFPLPRWLSPKARPFADRAKRSFAKSCGYIATGALTVTCGAFTSGCVPIPVVKWTSLPNVESKLPADLRASGDDVLVVKQMSSSSTSGVPGAIEVKQSPSIVTADFMKGSELLSFTKTLKLSSTSGLGLVVPIPLAPISVAGVVSSDQLDKLCVVTRDGRLIALAGVGRELPLLDARRRDAIVAALRAGGNSPFAGVDGPCGVSGAVEWPVELRSRTIDFLARIPVIAPSAVVSELVANEVLATALRNSWTTENQANLGNNGAMLLVSGIWRGVSIAERPRFLTAEDFDRFSTSNVTVDPEGIIALLPTYASGSYDPSNVSVQSFCLTIRDGRAISAAGPTYLESSKAKPRLLGWKKAALSVLRSESGKFDWQFPCIPPDTRSWSDTDRAAALGFLEAIRAPDGD
jgi:hypothetical protein